MNKVRNASLLLLVYGVFGAIGIALHHYVGNYAAELTYSIFLITIVASLLVTFAFKVNDAIKGLSHGGIKHERVQHVAYQITVRLWTIICFAVVAGIAVIITRYACQGSGANACTWATSGAFALVCTVAVYGVAVPLFIFFDLRKFERAIENENRRLALMEKL